MHVKCWARDLHDFLKVTLQLMGVRKAHKLVSKHALEHNLTY